MLTHLRPALVTAALMTGLTGLAYPYAVTGIARTLLPAQAAGSLVRDGDTVIGSALVGQSFTSDQWFHARPSATTGTDPNDSSKTIDAPYNGANSMGSNLGPLSAKLIDRVKADSEALKAETGASNVPADAVTTSASGLDPDISPAYARLQVARVAKARNLDVTKVRALVETHIRGRDLGILGEPRVNVLRLNMALKALGS